MSKVIDFFARRARVSAARGAAHRAASQAGASAAETAGEAEIAGLIRGFSLEVMPRTAAKIESFAEILPQDSRVYIAHIDGTPIEDMVATARRIAREGFEVMPHFPARSIADKATLADWIARYQGEAGVNSALLLGGGIDKPRGDFHCSMQLMETGLFDRAGFRRLHVAGHPEGNKDIDPDGSEKVVMEALRWKQDFAARTDAEMAIATQFVFDAKPVVDWAARLRAAGVTLPIHVGVAGPAKLQTLIKYALTCGVGPSVQVLQKRAADVTRLVLPFTPDEVLGDIAAAKLADPELQIAQVHFFPLGGIGKTAEYAAATGAAGASAVYA